MSTSSPPWVWTIDHLPQDLEETWIRITNPSFKPVLAQFHAPSAYWSLTVDGLDLTYPYYLVVQWRPQSP